MTKDIEKARKEIAKWEVKAGELAQEIQNQEQHIETLRDGLGEVVISGGDVDKATAEVDKATRRLEALRSGYTAALLRVEAGKEALAELEKAWAEDRVKKLRKEADKAYGEALDLMGALEEKCREVETKAREAETLKADHDIRLSYPYHANYWGNLAGQFRRVANRIKRIGPEVADLR